MKVDVKLIDITSRESHSLIIPFKSDAKRWEPIHLTEPPEKHDCKVNGSAKGGNNSGAKNRRIMYYLTDCIRDYIFHPPSPSST